MSGHEQREFVYIVSTYAEDGAEDVHATLRRDSLVGLLDDVANADPMQGLRGEPLEEARAALRKLLERPDDKLAEQRDGWGLNRGWGGAMLHVIRLS